MTPLEELARACWFDGLESLRECVAECVAQGIDINGVKDDNEHVDKGPLLVACEFRNLAAVEYLLQCGADPNVHGYAGWTPLHRAIQDDREFNIEVVKVLLAHGADVMEVDDEKNTALHWAVQKKKFNRELLEMLLDAGADITATAQGLWNRDIDEWSGGFTPLLKACWHGAVDAAEFLLHRGVDVDARDTHGLTSLRLAAVQYHIPNPPLVELLLKHGADPNSVDNEGNSIVWKHAYDGKVNVDVLRLLLNYGLDILSVNSADRPLLHRMVWKLDTPHDALDMLLERGVPVNSLNKSGETALHVVCSRDWELSIRRARYLLSRGAQDALVVENADGYLPLHCATKRIPCGESNAQFLRLLLESGADVNARTRDGYSPLSLLLDHSVGYHEGKPSGGHQAVYECVQLLCSQGAEWDDSCERRLTVTAHFMNSSQDDSIVNVTDTDQAEDSLSEQVKERVKAWKEAPDYRLVANPLLFLSGMRACIQFWSEERRRGGKDVELTHIPSEVYVQGEASVQTWLKNIQESTAAQRVRDLF